jgi:hypothetical protein
MSIKPIMTSILDHNARLSIPISSLTGSMPSDEGHIKAEDLSRLCHTGKTEGSRRPQLFHPRQIR